MSNREALAIPSFDDDLDDFAPRGRAGQGSGECPLNLHAVAVYTRTFAFSF